MVRAIDISERRVHQQQAIHKNWITLLPQSDQRSPLYRARGVIRCAAGYCRRQKQLWDCSQLHLPCRRG